MSSNEPLFKSVALVAVLVVLVGCGVSRQPDGRYTPALVDPPNVVAHLDAATVTTTTYPPNYGTGVCGRWYTTAIDAGWTDAQWPTVNRIMYAESQCVPTARNPNSNGRYGHARGLMQVMDGLWPADCGITADQLYDPYLNLRCALHVYNEQGFEAWSTY